MASTRNAVSGHGRGRLSVTRDSCCHLKKKKKKKNTMAGLKAGRVYARLWEEQSRSGDKRKEGNTRRAATTVFARHL